LAVSEAKISWDALGALSDVELAVVSSAAVHVVEETAGLEHEVRPRAVVAQDLRELLDEAGLAITGDEATYLVTDSEATRTLALAALSELSGDAALRSEIDGAYARRSDLMVVDGGTLLAGALLVLAIKVKRVKIGDVTIEFYELKASLIEQIRQLLGK
jgi:hypothetical protein